MKKYLSTLHTKPEHHKQRFALLVSGCLTLIIFAVWVEARFANTSSVAAVPAETVVVNNAASPLQDLKASASEAWSLLTGQVDKAKEGLKSVDLQNNYTQVRDDALNNR